MILHCYNCGDEIVPLLTENGDWKWVHADNARVECVMEAKPPKGSYRTPEPVTLAELLDQIAARGTSND